MRSSTAGWDDWDASFVSMSVRAWLAPLHHGKVAMPATYGQPQEFSMASQGVESDSSTGRKFELFFKWNFDG